jgi:hypothetical protein
MKKRLWSFLLSKNRKIYIGLALKFKITPWKVYNLAHGKSTKSYKDNKVLNELKKHGVIDEIRFW